MFRHSLQRFVSGASLIFAIALVAAGLAFWQLETPAEKFASSLQIAAAAVLMLFGGLVTEMILLACVPITTSIMRFFVGLMCRGLLVLIMLALATHGQSSLASLFSLTNINPDLTWFALSSVPMYFALLVVEARSAAFEINQPCGSLT